MTECFNGHTSDRPGCRGCHFAFHVLEPGRVAEGRLIPPVVDGPEDCDLCHEARHDVPAEGCPRCAGRFAETLALAMKASQPVREEVLGLKFHHWFLGWQATVTGWLAVIAAGVYGDWFRNPDGSIDLLQEAAFIFGIPLMQWVIRRQIRRKERLLPTLGPRGEIVFGDDPESGEDDSFAG